MWIFDDDEDDDDEQKNGWRRPPTAYMPAGAMGGERTVRAGSDSRADAADRLEGIPRSCKPLAVLPPCRDQQHPMGEADAASSYKDVSAGAAATTYMPAGAMGG